MLTVIRKMILLVCTGIILFPVAYTIMNVFMSTDEIMQYYSGIWMDNGTYAVFHIFPDQWSLESFYKVLLASPDYLRKFWNSIGLAGTIVIGQLIISILAGYGFSRFRFAGRTRPKPGGLPGNWPSKTSSNNGPCPYWLFCYCFSCCFFSFSSFHVSSGPKGGAQSPSRILFISDCIQHLAR